MRRRAVFTAVLAFLAGCGGGVAAVQRVSIYGDSATTGAYLQDGQVLFYSPRPVEMMNADGPVPVVDHSANGLMLCELVVGGPVAMGAQGGQTVARLDAQLAADPNQIVVIALGHVDALFGSMPLAEFLNAAADAVAMVRAAGRAPVIRGLINFEVNGTVSPAMLTRLRDFAAGLRALAMAVQVPFIEVPQDAEAGPDGLHPSPAYHARIAQATADQLRALQ